MNNWKHAVVLGAAGKMGSGISLLLLQQVGLMEDAILTLEDVNPGGFPALRDYLHKHLLKYAQKNLDDHSSIENFVSNALEKVRFVSSPEECLGAEIVFEAVAEDIEIKSQLLRRMGKVADPQAYYFSNTSSIPISVLAEASNLVGRLIGFHFYNPPAVQKLLEIIEPRHIDVHLKSIAMDIAKRLNKTIVFSNDVAGFIGNGHFIREIVKACGHVRRLRSILPAVEAMYAVNQVIQEFLLRPMGIFQLIDYVGIDVCQHIAAIMSRFLSPSNFNEAFIGAMLNAGIKGGQHGDGSQKDGFFRYDKGKIVAIFDLQHKEYISCIGEQWENNMTNKIGLVPEGSFTWKELNKDEHRKEKIREYFRHLWRERSLGAELAQEFLGESRAIAYELVGTGVANSIEDVDKVLELGFYHLYGVDEPLERG